jgi:hypothetical protein
VEFDIGLLYNKNEDISVEGSIGRNHEELGDYAVVRANLRTTTQFPAISRRLCK